VSDKEAGKEVPAFTSRYTDECSDIERYAIAFAILLILRFFATLFYAEVRTRGRANAHYASPT